MALAPTLGPILGGIELWFGWRAAFVAISLYGAAGLRRSWRCAARDHLAPDLTPPGRATR